MSTPRDSRKSLDPSSANSGFYSALLGGGSLGTPRVGKSRSGESIRDLSRHLSDSLLRAEAWMTSLPARVEAEATIDDPTPDPAVPGMRFSLRLTRAGGSDWRILCRWVGANDSSFSEWRPLKDSALEAKIAAVFALPELLAEVERKQDDLAERLRRATRLASKFLKDNGVGQKEGA